MTTPVKVSVCLPVFDGKKYLGAAMESVLSQTEANFELVIVDDNSSDGSWSLIQEWAAKDPRIKASRNAQTRGLFPNYNRCLSLATGEFIKLFAQDDVLEPDTIKTMLDAFERNPSAVLVTTGKNWIDDSGTTIKRVVQFQDDRLIGGRDAILYNMIAITNWIGEPSTGLFRRRENISFDTRFCHYGDLDLWFQLLRTGDHFYIASPLVQFRRHEQSATSKNLKSMAFAADILLLGDKYIDVLQTIGETRDHYSLRATEIISMHVKHLVDAENLTAREVTSLCEKSNGSSEAQTHSAVSAKQSAEQFQNIKLREAFFNSSTMVAQLLHQLNDAERTITYRDKEIKELQDAMRGITESKVWKLTAPLRKMR
jgi:GT2 family glycosyltransferase